MALALTTGWDRPSCGSGAYYRAERAPVSVFAALMDSVTVWIQATAGLLAIMSSGFLFVCAGSVVLHSSSAIYRSSPPLPPPPPLYSSTSSPSPPLSPSPFTSSDNLSFSNFHDGRYTHCMACLFYCAFLPFQRPSALLHNHQPLILRM